MKRRTMILMISFFLLILPIVIFLIFAILSPEPNPEALEAEQVTRDIPELIISAEERQIFELFRADSEFLRAMNVNDYYVVITQRARNISKPFMPANTEILECTIYGNEIAFSYQIENKKFKIKNSDNGEIEKTLEIYNEKNNLESQYLNKSDKEFFKS